MEFELRLTHHNISISSQWNHPDQVDAFEVIFRLGCLTDPDGKETCLSASS
jgi:hypothetical protein